MSQPLNPSFASSSAAVLSLPNLNLSDDESRTLAWLIQRLFSQRPILELRGLYYDGLQKIEDLGISIPPSLNKLRTVMGWPQIGIDALDERAILEGFRYPGSSEVDDDLNGIWQANNLDAEAPLAHLDALIYGRSYIVVGPGDDSTNGEPLITAESPINMTAIWDARLRRPTAALQLYLDTDFTSDMYGQEVAALYLPDRSVFMARSAPTGNTGTMIGDWQVTDRDNHGLGQLTVVRMANRQRLAMRDGLSEITPPWMNTVDSACRTLLGMEVGREFHAAPRRYVLGAAEDAFLKPDGSPLAAWDTYMGKIWGLERDEEGNLPAVGEFKTGDPKVYTEIIDTYTEIFAGLAAVPAEYLGQTNKGNPTSADAIRAQEARLVKRIERKLVAFGDAWEQTMRLALLVRDGSIPDQAHRLETDWVDPNTPTPLQTSQAITQQVAQGILPADSDTVRKKLGWTALERMRLAEEIKRDKAAQFLAESVVSQADKLIVGEGRLEKALGLPPDPGSVGAEQAAPGTTPLKTPVQPPSKP